jgi:hypothetical protein
MSSFLPHFSAQMVWGFTSARTRQGKCIYPALQASFINRIIVPTSYLVVPRELATWGLFGIAS